MASDPRLENVRRIWSAIAERWGIGQTSRAIMEDALAALDAAQPASDAGTVEVRAAVGVDASGHWVVCGSSDYTDEEAFGQAGNGLEDDHPYCAIITARVPIPRIAEIGAKVETPEENDDAV